MAISPQVPNDLPAGKADSAAVTRGVTTRKQGEEEVRRSEEQFRNLANSIPQLVWIAKPDGWVYWYNQRWFDYTGTAAEQSEGWGWQTVHDPAVLPSVVERWKQ